MDTLLVKTNTGDEIDKETWRSYQATRCPKLKNKIFLHYRWIVQKHADRVKTKLPNSVDVDDLQSFGNFGLMEAIDNFDVDRGVKFRTFSSQRIRGAMLDELRNSDWVPRLVRTKAAKLDQATRAVESKLGRKATGAEIANHLDMSLADFDDLAKDANAAAIVSFSEKWADQDEKSLNAADLVEDRRAGSPLENLQRKDVLELITKDISVKERMILVLYYFEEMTMREIGLILKLSESRVCQLHSRILKQIRARLEDQDQDISLD